MYLNLLKNITSSVLPPLETQVREIRGLEIHDWRRFVYIPDREGCFQNGFTFELSYFKDIGLIKVPLLGKH